MSIALTAAAHPGLRGDDQRLAAERGLLLQSAAYTAAWNGDKDGMREMAAEAAAIAARLTGPVLLRDHGGGFSPASVQLHRISAEYSAGEPGAAIAAACQIPPASLARWLAVRVVVTAMGGHWRGVFSCDRPAGPADCSEDFMQE